MNRCCALIAVLESMLLARAIKIVLQHYLPLAEVRASIDPTCIPVRVRGMPKSSRGGGKSDRP